MTSPSQCLRRTRGIALVLVLAILVLITGLVVAFFSYVTNRRQVTASDAAGVRAEILARGAVDLIAADFVQEMRNGSTVVGTAPNQFFRVTDATKMLPERSVKTPIPTWSGSSWSNGESLNLIKQSASGKAFFTGGTSRASSINTATGTAPGGITFAASRWLMPRLFAHGFALADNQTPDWIYVSRDGSNPNTYSAALKDRADTDKFVIGRFAYQIYDVGGLLDMNAAGFDPVGTMAATIGLKGGLLLADLRAIPGLSGRADTEIQSIVGWRNRGNWANLSGLLSFGSSHGWLRPNATSSSLADNDNILIGRLDLIALLENKIGQDAARTALPYLTSFSRTLNRPSFQPDPLRPKIEYGPAEGGNNAKGLDDAVNPGARSATDSSLLAGRRFGLDQIDLLKDPVTNAARIKELFGLTRTGNKWVYNHGRSDDIIPIGSVDMGTRKGRPDFFETLKAAIHAGSLGVQHGNAQKDFTKSMAGVNSSAYPPSLGGIDADINYQIIKIGANIIDQYDSDSYPTVITFNGNDISGSESLPGLCALQGVYTADQETTLFPQGVLKNQDWTGAIRFVKLLMPRLWNPYVNAATDPSTTPVNFRIDAVLIGADPYMTTGHRGGSGGGETVSGTYNPLLLPGHAWRGSGPWSNYTAIGGENYGPGESANPAKDLTTGCSINFSLPASWSVTWPYPFSDPRTLYKPDYPVAGVVLSPRQGQVQYSSINEGLLDGFNEKGASINKLATPFTVFGFPLGRGYEGPFVGTKDIAQNDPLVSDTGKASALFFSAQPYGGLVKLSLSCDDGAGGWISYDTAYFFAACNDSQICQPAGVTTKGGAIARANTVAAIRFDPRTNRWGSISMEAHPMVVAASDDAPGGYFAKTEWREGRGLRWGTARTTDPSLGTAGTDPVVPSANKLWTIAASATTNPAGVGFNGSTETYRYVDPDKIARRGSGAYWTAGAVDGQPMASLDPDGTFPFNSDATVRSNRPVMLNRPFRSIAELGHVFRDTPWKNLDFFTVESGDAALLDFFCLNANEDSQGGALTPRTTEGSPIVAGHVSLNTPHPEVLSAVIRGVIREQNQTGGGTGDPLDASQATQLDTLAKGIVSFTRATPFRNLSELVGYPLNTTTYKGFAEQLGTLLASGSDQKNKQRREAVLRAMADGGDSSTWNLLIDVVAQPGQLRPAASSLADFAIGATKRYWVHLAIDRFTGEIVDQKWEPIYE